jgi:hypothetical protein
LRGTASGITVFPIPQFWPGFKAGEVATSETVKAMRIVLQHKDSGLYLLDANTWTQHSLEALDFVSSTKAIEFCDRHKIDSMQIVLKFDQEKYDIVMPAICDADPVEKALYRAAV